MGIKIDDLPKDENVSEEEMKNVTGGAGRLPLPKAGGRSTISTKFKVGGTVSACGCQGMSQDPVT